MNFRTSCPFYLHDSSEIIESVKKVKKRIKNIYIYISLVPVIR